MPDQTETTPTPAPATPALHPANRIGFALLALAFAMIPLVAWSKDAAVAGLALGALAIAFDPTARAAVARPTLLAPYGLFALAFAAWTVVSFAWTPEPYAGNWARAAGAAVLIVIALRCLFGLSPDRVTRLGKPLIGAVLALLALLVVERLDHGYFIGLERVGDSTERLFDLMSPGLALLCCLLYPAAVLVSRSRGAIYGAALIAACFLLGLSYRMDAAPFAIAAATISFALVLALGVRGWALVIAGIAAVMLLWGPTASWAWRDDMHDWFTLHANYNWGYRIEIWNRVYHLIGTHPWIGHGFDSARTLGHVSAPDVSFLHPHDGFLQVWLELGLVGVLLFLAASAAAARSFATPSNGVAPDRVTLATGAASVTATAVFWSISFGIWQGWWLAAIGLMLCAVTIVARTALEEAAP